uniref:Uncharacterized protein n=1 Tax=Anopheles darlingi TaxID=43151 RepID=A0A2M4D346_ANODA
MPEMPFQPAILAAACYSFTKLLFLLGCHSHTNSVNRPSGGTHSHALRCSVNRLKFFLTKRVSLVLLLVPPSVLILYINLNSSKQEL